MLSVSSWQLPQDASNNEIDSQAHITVTIMPKVTIGTEAPIHVTFSRCTHDAPMYTTIQTYNVIPSDSAIFKCIEMDDLIGFRRLISDGKASVTDINESGFSLLAVSPHSHLKSCLNFS